ncbi:patatin-like phospholipase family protein [Vibrio hippocampi]|uniref:PNPLA domain-containing protein n=1 Tax=Vibrio hippocampi TaxID=654686 RepID=A0ABM8ZI52_9VIBR|nr:DUF6363 domain-containing protein [Vibrio hippocampi]CAH0526522.1 hypothetical protein VHP8226_01876 [Vibrio hippocampi]
MTNSGLITNTRTVIDNNLFSQYSLGKTALVAQGGGQRGIFTSGVLDAFLLSNFDPFDEFYGTSAGALNLCAFLSRQPGLGKSFIVDLTTHSNFFNLFGFIRRKQYLDMRWALDKISAYPYQLDIDMGQRVKGNRQAFAAVTDFCSLKDQYLPMLEHDWFDVLVATSAIPQLVDGPVVVRDQSYIDGGVSAAIPVQEAWRRGNRVIVVIRTEDAQSDLTPSPVIHNDGTSETWLSDSFSTLQNQWQQKMSEWSKDWGDFFEAQLSKANQHSHAQHLNLINGGRWLFGASDIYRLSHMFGEKFDSGIADMLMVHYQTYDLTQAFLNQPPDDSFVLQIAPSETLKSSSLLSNVDDILHDYQLGLDAGYRFIDSYQALCIRDKQQLDSDSHWVLANRR